MDLYEYQARDLFESHGVPVLKGSVATTVAEAVSAAEAIGGVVVVKAQVKVGGRGKAGGVKVAKTIDEVREHATIILGMDIKGHTVNRVMIAQGASIAEEYYVSILVDRAQRQYLVMASTAGGVEIEQVAHETPELLAMVGIDPLKGIDRALALSIVQQAKFPSDIEGQVADVLVTLWKVFQSEDATLVEVNPLVKTSDGRIIALDGKVSLD
ncbi:MAG: ATP-grasp domain-containing protein, partial [Actinomycetes bacterium]